MEGTVNNTNWTNSANETEAGKRDVAVVTTIVFALIEILTNGGLLVILFILWKKVGRYVSFVQIAVLLSVVVKAVFDLSMRLPLFILGSERVPPAVCISLSLLPDYTMLAILVSLPLVSAERLVKLWVSPAFPRKTIRRTFTAALVTVYLSALVVIILPATSAFIAPGQEEVNVKCGGHLRYGLGFSYLYSSLTALSVILVIVFSAGTIALLRLRLRDLEMTISKKSILKRGVVLSSTMTVVLFIATVPFALVFQLVLICSGQSGSACDSDVKVAFRSCVILQKLAFSCLPVLFLLLNKPARRKVWQFIRRKVRSSNVASQGPVSTSSEKLSSDFVAATAPSTQRPGGERVRTTAPRDATTAV